MVTHANPLSPSRHVRVTPLPSAMRSTTDPSLIGALAAVYLTWGTTYLATRIAVAELPATLMTSIRFTIAGFAMLAIARRRGAAWPTAAMWRAAIGPGLLLFVCGSGFVAISEITVSSGGAAVVCATMPLWMAVIAAVGGERPSPREWLSLVIGLFGVIVLIGSPSLAGNPWHVVLLLCSPGAWAVGSLWSRRAPKPAIPTAGDTALTPAMQLLVGGAALALIAVASGESVPVHASARAWGAVAYLIVFGSLIGFTAYDWLLRNSRTVVASSYAYVNPVLAVLVGAALYDEPLAWTTALANALIVAAVVLALRKPRG
jgi:drug/metabolite transporter (DMT)-like permease